VREKGLLSWSEALRKCTLGPVSRPASAMAQSTLSQIAPCDGLGVPRLSGWRASAPRCGARWVAG
jgi:hypothetical protein